MSGYSGDDFCTRFGVSKSPLPYFPGQQFVVRAHNPPPQAEKWPSYNPDSLRERSDFHPLDRCLLHPPSPGSDGSQTVNLMITEAIRFQDNKTSQIGLVKVLEASPPTGGPPTNTTLVAKFYDTLHFNQMQDDCNPVFYTDWEYVSETEAYAAMSRFQGTLVPTFYGSFTLELPAKKSEKRLVRLILMEFIPGIPMDKIDPTDFSQPERQNIIKMIIDMETLFHSYGVVHDDMYARNIMMDIDSKKVSTPKLRVIDFGHAVTVGSHFPPGDELHSKYPLGLQISPILRWHKPFDLANKFKGWIDWDWVPWLQETYKHTKKSITEEMKEIWGPHPPRPIPRV